MTQVTSSLRQPARHGADFVHHRCRNFSGGQPGRTLVGSDQHHHSSHRAHWQKVAILFSAAWIVLVGVSTGVYAYHQFACKPTVELLADGTIIRHACIATAHAWRTIAEMAGYLIGGVVVVSLLSWIFLGWPSDVLSAISTTRGERAAEGRKAPADSVQHRVAKKKPAGSSARHKSAG